MLIKEYRIPLPLTVEEYRIAQLYMIAVSFICLFFFSIFFLLEINRKMVEKSGHFPICYIECSCRIPSF